MKDFRLSLHNLKDFLLVLKVELDENPTLVVSTQNANIGKWGMARLWRQWMSTTAKKMGERGCVMPLMQTPEGESYGSRPFNAEDAHELFTAQWLGVDSEGERLSWSRSGRDGMRPATKGERFNALRKHEEWCVEKGITLLKPRDSEYCQLEQDQEQ